MVEGLGFRVKQSLLTTEAYDFPRAVPLGVGSYGTVMLATDRRPETCEKLL